MPSKANRAGIAHVYVDRYSEWRWRLQAPNGEIVADGAEGYTRRSEAIDALGRVQVFMVQPLIYIYDPEPWDPMKPRNRGPRKSDPRPPVKRKAVKKTKGHP